jgi:ABC-type spermidine/putrescine transport system permease subunit I
LIVLFTVRTALLATLLLIVPGTLMAWVLVRRDWRGKSIVDFLEGFPSVTREPVIAVLGGADALVRPAARQRGYRRAGGRGRPPLRQADSPLPRGSRLPH